MTFAFETLSPSNELPAIAVEFVIPCLRIVRRQVEIFFEYPFVLLEECNITAYVHQIIDRHDACVAIFECRVECNEYQDRLGL